MRKPNGYGAVIKLSGNRRKPYAVRITTGWTPEGKQQTKYMGYYSNRKDAEIALADFNKNPYVISENVTLGELYRLYSDSKGQNLAENSSNTYKSAFKVFDNIIDYPIQKLNLGVLQRVIDASDKNEPLLLQSKTILSNLFEYAIKHELIPPERKQMVYHLDFSDKGNPNAIERNPFTKPEIETLCSLHNEISDIILILIYAGFRINELLKLKEEDVHISERYIDVKLAKTKAGVRKIPIAEKLVPLMEAYPYGKYKYDTFLRTYWKPLMKSMNTKHLPHDTRHTIASLLAEAKVDDRVIRSIIGHKGKGITEEVYTHISLETKLEAINLAWCPINYQVK